jgi:Uma2 family endonuclease
MTALIKDRDLERALIRRRRRLGLDRYDEVWDGVYVMSPAPRLDHQFLTGRLDWILRLVVEQAGRGEVCPSPNVSDREVDWRANFRIPETAVVMLGGRAKNCGTHLLGGPDFLIEIASPRERVEEKLPFYSAVGTREALLILRAPRRLQLFRHDGVDLKPVGESSLSHGVWLESQVVPLAFRLFGDDKPRAIEVRRTDEPGEWQVPL